MKRFQNNVLSSDIAVAVCDAERLLAPNSPMLKDLRSKNDFAFNSGNGEQVYKRIIECTIILPVFTYKPKWPWSKALGYSAQAAIYINLYKLDNLVHADIVGLLCHEWLHGGPGFSHGNNYKTAFKVERSVNYFVSENISRWL